MAGEKISELTPAVSITGTELIPVATGGNNKSITPNQIAALATTDLVIGSDVQAHSDKLDALAAQTWAADTITYQTSTSAVSTTSLTAFGRSLIDDADAATARSTLGLVIGTNVQAYNANLAAFAGLSLVADRLPYANGTGTLALATFTTFGRSLVDDADATAGRTTLGLGSLATLSTINGGNWSGTDLALADGGTGASTASAARTNLGFADGTYTPTLTNVANMDSSTVGTFRYLQVGNTVTVSGNLTIDATAAATFTQVGISLPVASNFTSIGDCCGTCVGDGGSNGSGVVMGDSTNDRATMYFVPAFATGTVWYVHFTYTVK